MATVARSSSVLRVVDKLPLAPSLIAAISSTSLSHPLESHSRHISNHLVFKYRSFLRQLSEEVGLRAPTAHCGSVVSKSHFMGPW
uniref:Uncharacterized protein n=1 Tax=Lutzomyia longipalpis TaxID=7200 RepID=A0A1B0CIH4_LUTLO